eukprot:CAMPEP_0168461432 /NCGR_PEP_ID=MMETSP0228-20121227/53981_1 /TAXON_ID=133427 /ORGANISM="Protoceratium reticulatum, Strain CCCM 535 (=CCMP 1889)" /LENGTH=101 /DNA_ID=CAMNT_0008476745 /DNA_START=53 /DNA_END=358 /DNA_ORIENTATION=+
MAIIIVKISPGARGGGNGRAGASAGASAGGRQRPRHWVAARHEPHARPRRPRRRHRPQRGAKSASSIPAGPTVKAGASHRRPADVGAGPPAGIRALPPLQA